MRSYICNANFVVGMYHFLLQKAKISETFGIKKRMEDIFHFFFFKIYVVEFWSIFPKAIWNRQHLLANGMKLQLLKKISRFWYVCYITEIDQFVGILIIGISMVSVLTEIFHLFEFSLRAQTNRSISVV